MSERVGGRGGATVFPVLLNISVGYFRTERKEKERLRLVADLTLKGNQIQKRSETEQVGRGLSSQVPPRRSLGAREHMTIGGSKPAEREPPLFTQPRELFNQASWLF